MISPHLKPSCLISHPSPLVQTGSVHAGELTAVFGKLSSLRTNDFQSRWVSFITNLDPNYPGLPRWETYGPEDGQVLEFKDWGSSRTIPDTFRSDGMNFIIQNLKNFRLIAPWAYFFSRFNSRS